MQASNDVERTVLMRLLISCPDKPGIVSAVSRFLFEAGANIVRSDQHSTDPEGGAFFLRMEFAVDERKLGRVYEQFGLEVAEPFDMTWRIWNALKPKRVVVMVSRYDHCLLELLWRWRRGELGAEIVLVTSNHPDLREEAEFFGVAYEHVPVDPEQGRGGGAAARARARARATSSSSRATCRSSRAISSSASACPMINIHHSFLPAFAGREPYRRAKERGVKLIGATAHYVTEELDAGPIIEQDVIRVTHRDDVADAHAPRRRHRAHRPGARGHLALRGPRPAQR